MFIKQYELWQTCNNNCLFCFNKAGRNTYIPEQQMAALNFIISDLDKVVTKTPDLSIELIGGEFFQGQLANPAVYSLFFQLLHKIKYLGDTRKIKQVVIFATLTIGDQKDLYKALDILCGGPMEVWVSTSYDTYGRFNTEEKAANWDKQMKKLASIPDIYRNTTIIFTQDFCEKVLTGSLDLQKFRDLYKTTLFFKHPLPILVTNYYTNNMVDSKKFFFEQKEKYQKENPWFFPKRKDAIKVLTILKNLSILDRFMGLNYRADDLDSKFTQEEGFLKTIRDKAHNIENASEDKSPCGHLLTYACYGDSEHCILCDKENIDDN